MQSTKSNYCFALCLFTIIFFVSNTQVIAYEAVKKYPAILVDHLVFPTNAPLNLTHKASKNLQVSGSYNLFNLTDDSNSVENIINNKSTALTEQNVANGIPITQYISLLHLKNHKQINNKPLIKRVAEFPFFDIGNTDISDNNNIMIGNSHNLSFLSSRDSRELNMAKDNKFTLTSNSIIECQTIKKTNNYFI